ncbi:MAG: carbon-nitrogen hydrolase family protein [Pseudomonadota bacterium]
MRIAAAAYPIDRLESWDAYRDKLERWVGAADADLLVFPEYGAMELAALAGPDVAGDLKASIRAVSELLPEVDALHADLARRRGVHILAASAPAETEAAPVNRARLFAPGGAVGVQDKRIITRFEREEWGIGSGGPLRVFDTALGRIGVLICYDCEFPLLARAMIDAGAEVLLVPSCTDAETGYSRVRVGAMARALEGQCVTVQAPTVGEAAWSPAVDVNYGRAGVFGPPDRGFPPSGVLAEGPLNEPGWTVAEVDLEAIRNVRRDGETLNLRHWEEQLGPAATAEPVDLR